MKIYNFIGLEGNRIKLIAPEKDEDFDKLLRIVLSGKGETPHWFFKEEEEEVKKAIVRTIDELYKAIEYSMPSRRGLIRRRLGLRRRIE